MVTGKQLVVVTPLKERKEENEPTLDVNFLSDAG